MKYVLDIVEYVWNHPKRDKVFAGWTKDQLALQFARGFATKTASWSEDESGKIDGVVLTEVRDGKLRIIGILAEKPEILKSFLEKYYEFHAGLDLTGRRGTKEKVFSQRFIEKLYAKCN